MAQKKNIIDDAYPGDVVGLYDSGTFKIGDTLTEGEKLYYKGIPSFSPELFREVINKDPMKTKQLEKGVNQLSDEGVAQLFIHNLGNRKIIGTVGQLQFEVVAHRLEHEYGVKARILGSQFNLARWVTSDDPNELKKFMDANAHRVALDAVNAPTLLVDHSATLRAVEQQWPKIKFHALREHAGLVFQSKI